MDLSVIIITRDRPEAILRQTLAALVRQTLTPSETWVVDTSASDTLPLMIAAEFPHVRIKHISHGPRNMAWSRNQGIAASKGDIIAFLDDDSIASPQWCAEILAAYGNHDSIGGVGGRIIEGPVPPIVVPPEQKVASLDTHGRTLGNFNALTNGVVEVDHLKGCNMSFRRSVLASIGNFDEAFNGPVRDETDVCVRVRLAGYKLAYNPNAMVEHLGFSLFAHKRIQIESVKSGFTVAKLDSYYVSKNFGVAAWSQWYVMSNAYAFARAFKVAYMVFARVALSIGGGVTGLFQARKRSKKNINTGIGETTTWSEPLE